MRIVLTLLVRDEADIIGSNLAYHLSQVVDFVIATDNRSRDGTGEILREYARHHPARCEYRQHYFKARRLRRSLVYNELCEDRILADRLAGNVGSLG